MGYSAELKVNSQGLSSSKHFWLFLAIFTVPISGLSIDIYVPSLPAVSHYFGVEKSFAQLSITFYMMGLGAMQLFAGGITDSFGRKNPYLIAMSGYILATILIPFSQHINEFLLLRFIQGITVAAIVVPMRSVVSDLYEGPEYLKVSNYMFLAWSMGPIVAPVIGGYLQHYFNWQANFYFLSIYSIISFVLIAMYLPETSQHRYPFHIVNNFKRYAVMLLNKDYVIGLLMNCLLYSFIILFAVVGPFLIQVVLHYSDVEFGHFAFLTGLAWFLGGTANRFLMHIPLNQKAKIAFFFMLFISLLSVMIDYLMPMNLYLILTPIMMLLFIGGIVFPNNFARGIALFPKMTGSANALFGSFVFFVAGIISGAGTFLKFTSEIPLAITYVVIISLCLFLGLLQKVNQ